MDNTIDSLQIDIVDSATNADKSLDALVSSLKKLDRIGKSNSFSIIQKQLKGIAGVKFDRLESQLTSITKNLKELKGYQNFLKNINLGTPTIDTVAVSESVDAAVEEIGRAREEILTVGESFGDAANVRPAWLDDVQTECDSIVESFGVSAENINSAKKELLTMLSEKKSDFGDQSAFIGATNFTDTLDDKMTKLSLKATLLQEKSNKAVNEWVFPHYANPSEPLHPDSAYTKLKTMLKRAGLPLIRFHDLRHTFATHAMQGGVDAKTLAGILGHTDASFTLDTYTHVTSDMQKNASDVVGRMMQNFMRKE